MQDAVDEEEATSENTAAPADPRIAQLEQQQQMMQDFLAQQETMRVQQEADYVLEQEINELKTANPDFSEDDVREVLMRAAFQLQSSGKTAKLSDVAQEYVDKTVNRIRAVPRPGDSAPRLLPTSGGMPGGQQAKPLGQLSRDDVQNLIASSIQQGR